MEIYKTFERLTDLEPWNRQNDRTRWENRISKHADVNYEQIIPIKLNIDRTVDNFTVASSCWLSLRSLFLIFTAHIMRSQFKTRINNAMNRA